MRFRRCVLLALAACTLAFCQTAEDATLAHFQKSLEDARKSGNVHDQAEALAWLCNVYATRKRGPEAVDAGAQALKLIDPEKDGQSAAVLYQGLAIGYALVGDAPQANKYQELYDEFAIRQTRALVAAGQDPIDFKEVEDLLKFARQKKDAAGEAKALDILGSGYFAKSDFSKAESYLKPAQDLFRKLGDWATEAGALIALGKCELGLDRLDSGLGYWKE